MAFHYTDLMEYLLMQIGLCGPEGRSFFFFPVVSFPAPF